MVGKVEAKTVLTAEDRTKRAFKSAAGAADGLAKKYAGVSLAATGLAVAGVAVAAGLAVMTKRAIENADAIGKTADKVGVGVEALQEYRFAAELAGVNSKTLDMALQRLTRRVGQAAQGSGELKETLERYGIAVRDAEGNTRSTEAVLDDLADAIQGANSEAEQLLIGFKAFDSEGAALVNALRNGSKGLADMRREARELGIVLDESMVRQAEDANDTLTRMSSILSVNLDKALISLAPSIEAFGTLFAMAAPHIGDAATAVIKLVGGINALSVSALKEEVGGLNEEIAALLDTSEFFEDQQAMVTQARAEEIFALRKERAELLALIETKEADAEVTKKLLALPPGEGATGAGPTDKQLDANQKFLDKLEEQNLAASDREQELIKFRLARDLAALKERGLNEEDAARARKLIRENAEIAAGKAADKEAERNAEIVERGKQLRDDLYEVSLTAMGRLEELEQLHFDQQLARIEAMEILQTDKELAREQAVANHLDRLAEIKMEAHEAELDETRRAFASLGQEAAFAAAAFEALNAKTEAARIAGVVGMFGAIANVQNTQSKKMFQIQKAFAIGQALMKTFEAANTTYAAFAYLPPLAAAMAAITVAFGLANVQAIASTKFAGGSGGHGGGRRGGGGGGGGGRRAPPVQNVQPIAQLPPPVSRQINITIESDTGVVSTAWIRDQLIPGINEAIGDGFAIVVS